MTENDRYFNVFFDYVEQLNAMDPIDQALCKEYMIPVEVKKDAYISKEGQIPKYHNFIVSGYMRKYIVDDDGEQLTIDLNGGPRFFTPYDDFAMRQVTKKSIHCITDCEILRLPREVMDIWHNKGVTYKDYNIKILQQIIAENKQRAIDLNSLSAEQRYIKLVRSKPNIVKNVPLKYIASYLGIQPGSLSRIRKELSISYN